MKYLDVAVVVQSLSRVWLQPHGLQHARLPCPSLFPGVCSNSCPLSHWCHLTISSSVIPFSCCMLLLLLGHFSHVRLYVTPQTSAHQVLLPLGFSRQEHWSGLPLPSPMHESEKVKVKSLSRVQLLATPWTAAYQAPLPMGFSRQEDWSGVPLPSLLLLYKSCQICYNL